MYKNTPKCNKRKEVFKRRVEIIHYALRFSPEDVKYSEHPPKKGVSNKTITSFLDALKNPSKANLERLKKGFLKEA